MGKPEYSSQITYSQERQDGDLLVPRQWCNQINLMSSAGVVKLVYTPDLGSGAERREGSSPFSRTSSLQRL